MCILLVQDYHISGSKKKKKKIPSLGSQHCSFTQFILVIYHHMGGEKAHFNLQIISRAFPTAVVVSFGLVLFQTEPPTQNPPTASTVVTFIRTHLHQLYHHSCLRWFSKTWWSSRGWGELFISYTLWRRAATWRRVTARKTSFWYSFSPFLSEKKKNGASAPNYTAPGEKRPSVEKLNNESHPLMSFSAVSDTLI